MSRRHFFGISAAGAAALTGLVATTSAVAAPNPKANPNAAAATAATRGGGKQVVLDNIVDGGKLALPQGVTATRVSTIGVEDLLDDVDGAVIGTTPSNLDGAGAFAAAAGHVLIRNHECRADARVTVPLVEGTVYDAGIATGMGGNTNVLTDDQGNFIQQWVSLSGTIRNCAGGETPWGTWLTCEEDTTRKGTEILRGGTSWGTAEQDHGYVFEVFPGGSTEQLPLPIKAWGRAVWEGAAIDPSLTKAYVTEDTRNGLFYRWLAPEGETLGARIAEQFGENDGVLQAAQLVKNGTPLVHYGELTAVDLNQAYPVTWIDGGEDRQAQEKNLRDQYPGATVHPKIEGCWPDAQGLWFTVSYTNGTQLKQYPTIAEKDSGMIMFYDFADETLTLKEYWEDGNTLGAVVPDHETEAVKQFHGPDNITVSPWGTVVVTEDGDNPCSIVAFSERNGSREFARDLADRGEWAGPAFTDSGTILFASIQGDCTYAITGGLGKVLAN